MNRAAKTIRGAAIQMDCEPGRVEANLHHAESMIRQAADRGATLTLLPELMPSGYMATEAIWDHAETMDGRSVRWLQEMARRHTAHIGFTFLETELPGRLPFLKSSFPGLSSIVSATGELLVELDDREGVIVADIELEPAVKKSSQPEQYGRMWAFPVPWFSFIWPMTQKRGEQDYRRNPRRALKARAISGEHR